MDWGFILSALLGFLAVYYGMRYFHSTGQAH